MKTQGDGRTIAGTDIIPIDDAGARAWFDWLIGSGTRPAETRGVGLALCHSDSGVTWGFLDEHEQWNLGSSVDSVLCPVPAVASLHELRLIGQKAEVLIWRGDGKLQGRILADDGSVSDSTNPLRPMDEGRKLRGAPSASPGEHGFIRYVDEGGAQHLSPSSFPDDFAVRHYFEQDPVTGSVRIAATRLVAEKLS